MNDYIDYIKQYIDISEEATEEILELCLFEEVPKDAPWLGASGFLPSQQEGLKLRKSHRNPVHPFP